MTDYYLTTSEAAAALGISRRAVQAACERGTLRAIHGSARGTGHEWLISREAMADYRANVAGRGKHKRRRKE